jgi:GT2 family glycosyltransferase
MVEIMSATNLSISIIIVNWNTEDMLCDCLDSVYANLGTLDAEVFVVDNASNDRSVERVRKNFKSVKLIVNQKNLGFAAANNQALKICTGRMVLLLNSDTIVLDDVLQKSVAYLDANPKVGAIGCRVLNTDGTMQPTCSRFPSILNLLLQISGLSKLTWPDFFDRYQMRRWDRTTERDVEVISGCYLLVRKEVVDKVGGLDEDFYFFGEETDWCLRISKMGWELKFAPVGQIIHHGGGSVRKLDYRRDLMLSSAMVKLHLKNEGWLNAVIVMLIVCSFNASRAVYWWFVSLVSKRDYVQQRRRHFAALVGKSAQIWPKGRTWKFD